MASSLFKTDNALKLLLSSAEAIEGGNLKRADKLLQDILVLTDEKPKQFEYESSVLKYFAEALARRAYGLPPASSSFSFPVIPEIHYHYNRYKINRVIKKVIDDALMGNRRLHLIDFSIPSYSYIFDGSVLRTLPNFSDDPLSVRLSYILPLVQAKHEDVSGEMKDLTEDAKEVNVKLENELKVAYANSLAEVDECKIDFRSREDEMVVVYYKFKLDKFVGDAKAMEMELVRLKKINPMIVIMLDFYSHHSDSNFLTCLEESFQYSSKTCKCSRDVNFSLRTSEYWLLNRDVSEVNNLIRRHQTLSEWQRLFSMADFTRISLSQEEDDVIVGVDCFHFGDSSFLEIIREEEECLILGYKGSPLFFLSAWKPKVEEDRHFNSISTNHQFSGGFNPNPSPLHPREPVQEDWTLNRLAALAEIYDMLKDLCCKYELPLALTWASKVNNRKDIMSDPNQKHTFLIHSDPCYVKDDSAYIFMKIYRHDMREQSFAKKAFAGKALQSSHGYHFEPSIRMLDKKDYSNYTFCDIDVVLAIRLQNRYTSNDVHVVEFYWPAKKPKSLALGILNDLKHRETKFITVQVQSTEVRFQKEAISNIPTSANTVRCLQAAEETEEVQAVERNGVNVERGVVSNLPSPMPTHSSSKVVAAPFNTPEGPHNQIVSNGDPEIGKANKEKLPRTKQRNSRPKIGKANKEKLPETTQRRLTSKVWEHFDRLLVGQEQVAKCKHCPKVLTGSSNSGTSHLRNHLNVCQKEQNQERSRLNFVKMIIKHRFPLDMADQEFFKNFVKDMQPTFGFESKDISSYIHRIYNEEREKLQLYFDQLACKLNLIVSLWKNNHGKTAYCCLIAHFIDDGWELKMKTLGLRTLEHINDTKAVGGIILSLFSEWNIGSKVFSITVDNSFLDDSMVQQIKEDCLSNLVSLSSTHWFINCTLLEDGFREMDDLLFNLKKSIEYVTETKHGRLKFQEAVDQVKLQDGKSWDDLSFKLESDFGILDSALRSREIICKLDQIDGNFKLNPSMEEWENAAALQSCLRCFDDIKGTQSLTVSLYFTKLCDIYKKFLHLEKSNHPFVPSMKRKFDYYWSLCSLAFAVAAVLDPRLKFKFVKFSYTEIYGRGRRMHVNGFHTFLRDAYYKYADEANNLTESNCSSTESTNDCLLDSFRKFESASNLNEEASELDCYLNEPLLPLDGAIFDILGWWCDKSQKFPILAKMARDFLAIPVSIFTPCSNIKATINNPAYNILNPESMEALVCSENWLETPKGNDGENHEPTQTTDKGKRKLDEDTCVRKKSKPSNCEKVISTEDIAKDSNNNDGNPSFDKWMEPQCSSSKCVDEKAEIMEASVRNRNRSESSIEKPQTVKSRKNWCYGETSSGNKSKASIKMHIHQEKSSSELNHGRNFKDVNETSSGDSSTDNDQSDQVRSSSSESDDETTLKELKEKGQWCYQDVRPYLVSNFTNKDFVLLKKLKRNKLNGELFGRDKNLELTGEKLAPLLMVPKSAETHKKYYIEESVINAFFKLLKKRSNRFPKAYINHYSFNSQMANCLIKGSTAYARCNLDHLRGVHKLFLPLCLSDIHWVLFYVDINEKKFSCLDPYQSSGVLSSNSKDVDKILQWFICFLLPKLGYKDANEWPYVERKDIPQQKNSVDCGVFVMKYGDCLTCGDFFPFTQKDTIHFRRRIFLDLYRGRLDIKK